ncbi:TetR/AcrR family transcriptional regulator [Arthrobacter halodurans]|uniref:TetR/AcrR family transcriptional regulator n=1 Tax=Arthrobacter halodurans TaxID=516699 RepID=A0ABV4UJB9_9MICC
MGRSTRDRILDAVLETIVDQGAHGLSIRGVAAAAGLSAGAVQHLFPTREGLLQAAMDRVAEEFTARLLAAIDPTRDAVGNLRSAALLLGGVGAGARRATVVWLAFTAMACTDPGLARAHREAWARLEDGLAVLVARVDPGADPLLAAQLLAQLDGLAIARALEPERMTERRAGQVIDAFLDANLRTG